ncbi:molybdopterin-dependent oxidoreductase [Bradyrhizobium iriomotense]|uniref:molybdopterin-dependent oxidoreductase n=1 Tax=Bradyrhizobium iriomotense TaxID=441950 RepID=UPI001FF06BD2|nr:molybdopterin-dependent oxidoreductase [Bradyrhizobium iriomotense]
MVGRLTHPMAYDAASDRYLPVEWSAFDMIGRELGALPDPNMAEFYTSGRTSNEAAFLYQLFVREYGTNNFPDCSNMCHEAGQNPGTNSPRMMTSLRNAARRGASIISFNPFRERALERFQAPQSPVEMITLSSTTISSKLAGAYRKAERAILVYGMGITQHWRGANNVQQIANLALLRGNVGREGAGVCPVRGHSNVQGDRTVGITEVPKADLLERLEQRFGFKPPAAPGHNVVTALEAMIRGEVKAFFAMGGNFAAAIPDWQATQAALGKLDLTVHVSTKLNRSHLIHGRAALILPCIGRTEIDIQESGPQSITVEDSMSMVHASGGRNTPASEHLLSEVAIIAGVAKATLGERTVVDWDGFGADYDRIRDAIEAVFPIFQGYNARIRVPGGFHLTSTARERIWATPSGKANFLVFPGCGEDPAQSDDDFLWLTTIRSHDQYNTTLYSMSDRYRGVFGQRDVVFLNEYELKKRGLADGDRVDLVTASTDGAERIARNFRVVVYSFPTGCCAAYYPETNPLVPLYARDPLSFTPSFKGVPIRLVRSAAARE